MTKTSKYKKTKLNKYIQNYKYQLLKEIRIICFNEKSKTIKDKSLGDFTIKRVNDSIDEIINEINHIIKDKNGEDK